MYKVTLFMKVSPKELEEKLLPVGFKQSKGSLLWSSEGNIFQIVPFGGNDRITSDYGYRLYFNSLNGGLYLYDMALSMFQPEIKGVEYNLTELERTKAGWQFYFKSRPSFKEIDARGIYQKGKVGIVIVNDNHLNLQVRPKRPKGVVPLNESLEEISVLLEEINPTELDIFSFLEVG
jgi:hypothetical protein